MSYAYLCIFYRPSCVLGCSCLLNCDGLCSCIAGRAPERGASVIWARFCRQCRDHREVGRTARWLRSRRAASIQVLSPARAGCVARARPRVLRSLGGGSWRSDVGGHLPGESQII